MGYRFFGAAQASSCARSVRWPVRSGAIPVLAEKFSTRPESGPKLADALLRSPAVTLTSGTRDGAVPDGLAAACGKTQLAASFARARWRARAVDLLIWIDASSRASILCGYAEAASATGLASSVPSAEQVAASFLEWLASTDRSWLVVLDDLTEAAAIDGLWPHGPAGEVVITARDSDSLRGRSPCLQVGRYSRRDAMSYLAARLGSDLEQRRGAIDLVAELGLQPLALGLASAVVANSWHTCADYSRRLAARQRELAATTGVEPDSASVACTLAADHAEVLLPGGGVRACLAFAALLDGHGIPVDVFATAAACDFMAGEQHGPPDTAFSALHALERVGLIAVDRDAAAPLVRVNPAIQAAVRAATPADVLTRATTAASAALLEAWPAGEQRTRHAQMIRSAALSLLRTVPGQQWADGCPAVLIRAGESFDSAGLAGPAMDYWSELTAASTRILGTGHPDSARLAERLGRPRSPADRGKARHATSEIGDAIRRYQRLLADTERDPDPGNPITIATSRQLAAAYLAAGKMKASLAQYERTLAESERSLGAEHPDTLHIAVALAAAYHRAGRLADAARLYGDVMKRAQAALGPAHPLTQSTRESLAVIRARLARAR